MELTSFIETKLNEYSQKIITGGQKSDEISFGELGFYLSLRRVLNGNATMQDVGLMDAINDTLQELNVLEKGKTFYK